MHRSLVLFRLSPLRLLFLLSGSGAGQRIFGVAQIDIKTVVFLCFGSSLPFAVISILYSRRQKKPPIVDLVPFFYFAFIHTPLFK